MISRQKGASLIFGVLCKLKIKSSVLGPKLLLGIPADLLGDMYQYFSVEAVTE